MKSYKVHFAYYSQDRGQFEGTNYTFEAENQFEARQKAWNYLDDDKEMKNASCISQCGVIWESSPLHLQDYFNMLTAIDKCTIKQIEKIDIPNNMIHQDGDRVAGARNAISECWGSLSAISNIAKDVGQAYGMIPPNVYEELHYAALIAQDLEQKGQEREARSLYKRISDAEKWDQDAIVSIDSLFIHGDIWLNGDSVYLSKYFSRDGIFPEKADLSDAESDYINRWRKARYITNLSQLPMFGEKDVIRSSGGLQKDLFSEYRVLVLRLESLPKEQQKPENILWTPIVHDEYERNYNYNSRNMITGVLSNFSPRDFAGVLRPEFANKIDFESLECEYSEALIDERRYTDILNRMSEYENEDEAEDEIF